MENDKLLEENINRAIKKDEEAFCFLINSIQSEMYKIAKIKLRQDDEIYEAIQETIILIFKHLKKIKNKQYFRTWSMKILINECLKIQKKKEKSKRKAKFINYDYIDEIENNSFENVESEIDMKNLLKCLNEKEKVTMMLYYGNNFTTKEISEILDESEGTIKSRISRAKYKIRNDIKEEK